MKLIERLGVSAWLEIHSSQILYQIAARQCIPFQEDHLNRAFGFPDGLVIPAKPEDCSCMPGYGSKSDWILNTVWSWIKAESRCVWVVEC